MLYPTELRPPYRKRIQVCRLRCRRLRASFIVGYTYASVGPRRLLVANKLNTFSLFELNDSQEN